MKGLMGTVGRAANKAKKMAPGAMLMKSKGSNKLKIGRLNILINQDRTMGFAASIIKKSSGVEAGNKITWVTPDTNEKFFSHPKAGRNNRVANSAGDFTSFFGSDLLDMELDPQSYDKIYLICPRFIEEDNAVEDNSDAQDACDDEGLSTEDKAVEDNSDAQDADLNAQDACDDDEDLSAEDKAVGDNADADQQVNLNAEDACADEDLSAEDKAVGDNEDAEVVDAEVADNVMDDCEDANEEDKELAFEKEQQQQANPEVIAKNQAFMRRLLQKAATLIKNEGIIIVLHPTISKLKLDDIAAEFGLEKLDDQSLDLKHYPELKDSDPELRRIPSAFHCYGKVKK